MVESSRERRFHVNIVYSMERKTTKKKREQLDGDFSIQRLHFVLLRLELDPAEFERIRRLLQTLQPVAVRLEGGRNRHLPVRLLVRLQQGDESSRDGAGRSVDCVNETPSLSRRIDTLDVEPARLIIGAVAGAWNLAIHFPAGHPGFYVKLAVGGRTQFVERHVQKLIMQAQAREKFLLNGDELFQQSVAGSHLAIRHTKHFYFGELMNSVVERKEALAR